MRNIHIVLGANYGDEGKGLVTDFLAYKSLGSVTNILFNGGPQRGHTVELKNGVKHIFRHFGSASMMNKTYTFIDEHFCFDPYYVCNEYKTIRSYNKNLLLVHPKCRVIFPWIIFLNKMHELNKSDSRDGSCGCGIWETIHLYEQYNNIPTIKELCKYNAYEFYVLCRWIINTYIPEELEKRHISDTQITHDVLKEMENIKIDDFYHWFMKSLDYIRICTLTSMHDTAIFEGGQGLLLDKDNKDEQPHVTSSNTDSTIPIEILSQQNITNSCIHFDYVTRPYLTRHGNGPLNNQCDRIDVCEYIDSTNGYNEFQGNIRYAPLTIQEVVKRCTKDFNKAKAVLRQIGKQIDCESIDMSIFVTQAMTKNIMNFMNDYDYKNNKDINFVFLSDRAYH